MHADRRDEVHALLERIEVKGRRVDEKQSGLRKAAR
jgi:hypothetical protein